MMDPRINIFLAPLPKSEHRTVIDSLYHEQVREETFAAKVGQQQGLATSANRQGLQGRPQLRLPKSYHYQVQ